MVTSDYDLPSASNISNYKDKYKAEEAKVENITSYRTQLMVNKFKDTNDFGLLDNQRDRCFCPVRLDESLEDERAEEITEKPLSKSNRLALGSIREGLAISVTINHQHEKSSKRLRNNVSQEMSQQEQNELDTPNEERVSNQYEEERYIDRAFGCIQKASC